MTLLYVALITAAALVLAYRFYGSLLARLFRLDPNAKMPSEELRDDVDYIPTEPKFLLGQHFSAIAAAGPIVGPILAGLMFGWAPAMIWIIVGAVLIGGVHDMGAIVASVRHKARSIAEVVKEHMNKRAFALFLTFIWLALVYIIVAFTDITAQAFVGVQTLENGETVSGGGIATSSLLYLLIPVAMGLVLKFTKLGIGWTTAIFLPIVFLAIWGGQFIPIDISGDSAVKVWDTVILVYCVIAAVVPMWLLLQPRGHLGGYFLYFALAAGVCGLLFSGMPIEYPAFKGWQAANGQMLAPFLFITIACGAVSGFHALIASGTTSKQLKKETHAKVLGYGTMMLEAGVAVIALSTVMILGSSDELTKAAPNMVFATGLAKFLGMFGIPIVLATSIMLMAFTTFVYDTLDVCTRLGRYIVQELTGWQGKAGMWAGTLLTAGVPLLFVTRTMTDAAGAPIPAWRAFWPLFGSANQLLAALTLLAITVWLWRTRRQKWVLYVAGLPTVFMYCMSCWALTSMMKAELAKSGWSNPVTWVGVVLLALAGWMLVEGIAAFMRPVDKEPVAKAA
ncbi:MAG: carbon starvation CstA family protein [Fimbriimonadaceae bacterium]